MACSRTSQNHFHRQNTTYIFFQGQYRIKKNISDIIPSMKKIFLLIVTILLITGCVSHPSFTDDFESANYPAESFIPSSYSFEKVSEGMEYAAFTSKEFPVRYHLLKINLETEGLRLKAFPDKEMIQKAAEKNGGEVPVPYIFKGIRTKEFAKRFNTAAAFNATPFGGKNAKWDLAAKIGSTRIIAGIHKTEGITAAAPKHRNAALVFYTDENNHLTADIIQHQDEEDFSEYDNAFGGFSMIVKDGEKISSSYITHDSRSACGLKDEGHTLYLLAVEGENPYVSEGLSFNQCADIFISLGCSKAMEFDGGSSTQLVVNGKTVMSYSFSVVQGNSFGFVIE